MVEVEPLNCVGSRFLTWLVSFEIALTSLKSRSDPSQHRASKL